MQRRLVMVVVIAVVVALVGWNLLLQGQLGDTRGYQQGVAAVLDAAHKPGSVAAILTPAGGTGSGIAAIIPRQAAGCPPASRIER